MCLRSTLCSLLSTTAKHQAQQDVGPSLPVSCSERNMFHAVSGMAGSRRLKGILLVP